MAGSCVACGARQPGSSSAASPSRWPSSCVVQTSAPWCPWAAELAQGWAGRQGGSPPGHSPPGCCCYCRRGPLLLPGKEMMSRIQRRALGISCVEMRQGEAQKLLQQFSSPRMISRWGALNPKYLPCLSACHVVSPCWRSAREQQSPLPASKGWNCRLLGPFYDGVRKVTEWERGFGERSSKERHKC